MARARTAEAAARSTKPGPAGAAAKKGEHVQVLSNAPLPEGDEPTTTLKPVLEQTNEVVADATEHNPDRGEEEAAVDGTRRWAMVVKGGKFLDRQGNRAQVHEGKEVDDRNYDFGALQRAGIKLRLLKPDERGGIFLEDLAH